MGNAGGVKQSWQNIDDMTGLVHDLIGLNFRGPVGDEGRGDTAFVNPMLIEAEWGIGGICPGEIVAHKCVRAPGTNAGIVTDTHRSAIGGPVAVAVDPAVFGEEFSAAAVI